MLAIDEAGQEVDGRPGGTAVRERHPSDLVAGQVLPIPAAVLADKGALSELAAEAVPSGPANVRAR